VRRTAAAADTQLTHCVSLNARSLNNKLLELHRLLADRPSVVSITETWLNSDNLLTDSGNYSIYRRDRLDRRGAGVCMLIDNDVFQSANVHIPCKYDCLEIIAVDLLNVHFTCRFINVFVRLLLIPIMRGYNIVNCYLNVLNFYVALI
jgi:hypothetical protein